MLCLTLARVCPRSLCFAPSGFGGGGATPSLFGSATAPAAAGTASLFGATSSAAPSTGLFGAAATSAAPSTGGLFGSTYPAPSTGGGLFGASVGQQQQQQQQTQAPQLFGQSQSAATASLFGNSFAPSSAAALQTATAPTVPKLGDPLPPSANEPSIESRLVAIKEAWDPASQTKCRFQTYFYNELPAGQSAAMYSRPVEGARRDEWDRATRENPDPERCASRLLSCVSEVRC